MDGHQCTTTGPRAMRGRRGVAMLMVVIALVVTTVLTTAILTTPDRLAPIAQNKSSSAAARGGGGSASNYTVASIERDLSAQAAGGKYMDDWLIAGGNADVVVTDPEGEAPDASDRSVVVTITSDAGGIARTVQRRVTLYEAYDPWIVTDPRMPEFAVFATETFSADGAKIGTWFASPESRSGVARLGLAGVRAGTVSADDFYVQQVMVDQETDASVRSWAKGVAGSSTLLPLSLSVGDEPAPTLLGIVEHIVSPVTDLLGGLLFGGLAQRVNVGLYEAKTFELDPGRYGALQVQAGGEIVLNNDAYAFDSFVATGASVITVRGDVRMVVYNSMAVTDFSQVVIEEGATLELWVGSMLYFDNSVLGPWLDLGRASERGLPDLKEYAQAERVRIGIGDGGRMFVQSDSIVFGDIHGIGAEIRVDEGIVVGRLSGSDVALEDAYVLYDPALDCGYSFANLKGPLYEDGTPIAGVDDAMVLGASQSPDDAHPTLKAVLDSHWGLKGTPLVSASGYTGVVSRLVPVDMLESEEKYAQLYELKKVRQSYLLDADEAAVREKLEAMGVQALSAEDK